MKSQPQFEFIQGVSKSCYSQGNRTLLFRSLVLFSRVSDKMRINATKRVLLKSIIKLNNLSSDEKHNL